MTTIPTQAQRPVALLGSLALVAIAGVAIAALPASAAVQAGLLPKLFVLGRMALLVALATWLLRSRGAGWAELGLRRPRSLWRVGALALVGYVTTAAGVATVSTLLLPALGLPAPDLRAFAGLKGDLAEYLFWAVPVALGSAAFGEELVFRGLLRDSLERALAGRRGAAHLAIVGQALLFGALHAYQGLGGVIVTALTGLVLGYVWLFGGRNLWPSIVAHGLMDFVSTTAMFAGVAPR